MGIVASVSVHLGVLVIAKDPAYADLAAVEVVAERAAATGHRVIARHAVADSEAAIRSQLARWFDDREVDVVIILSGESEVVSKAVAPLVTEVLPASPICSAGSRSRRAARPRCSAPPRQPAAARPSCSSSRARSRPRWTS